MKSITIKPGTVTRQLSLRLGTRTIARGKRYVIVVTARNATSSQTIRIAVRG